jgi:hypothetical protein
VNIKFNIYDIYGFAVPGFLLVAVLWLPFGLIQKNWPDPELSSALIGVVLVYSAGHLLQTVADQLLPSSLPSGRYPSSAVLDRVDGTFTDKVKERLAEKIGTMFGLDVAIDPPVNATDEMRKEVDRTRNDAFFLCRSALIKSNTVTYAERFEGLYALRRGFSAAFAVAVVYYLGWAYSTLWPGRWSGPVVIAGIISALIVFLSRNSSKAARWVTIGFLLLAAFAFERCYAGYKAFAQEFVKAIYRDFYLYEKAREGNNANAKQAGDD